jgi:hypothetical protein
MGGQRGVVLVLVLLAMSMLAAAGLGLALGTSVSRMGTANHDEAVALANAAESALELAARELRGLPLDEVLDGSRASAFVDGAPGVREIAPDFTVDLAVLTNQLTCGRTAACTTAQIRQVTAERPWGANNPHWRLFMHQRLDPPLGWPAAALSPYVVVWIGDDPREDDDEPLRDGAGATGEGRYIVRARAEAFGPRGGRRVIEAEILRRCDESPAGEVCAPGSRVQSWRVVSSQVP